MLVCSWGFSPLVPLLVLLSGSGGDREGPRDLKASQVTPRSALVSWKASSTPVGSYKLTYFTEGQEIKVPTWAGMLRKIHTP